ncbi:hypothetical protein M2422_000902 [Enterobacter sp. SLBN-59]|nr:hypothetical protein [Enterobacter sp. SLBN-59]
MCPIKDVNCTEIIFWNSLRGIYIFWQENDGRWFGTIDNSCGMSAGQLSATAKRSASPEVVDWVRLYIPPKFAPTFPEQLVYCF